jgi:hypothetical protein
MASTGYDLDIKIKEFDVDPAWLEPADDKGSEDDSFWDESWMDNARLLSYKVMKEFWERRSFKSVVPGQFVRQVIVAISSSFSKANLSHISLGTRSHPSLSYTQRQSYWKHTST